MQLVGEWSSYDETICSVDPSGRGTDETAAAFLSQRNGLIYLHEMSAYRDGYSDSTLLDILAKCRTYGVTSLVIETNFGDGIVGELFKKHLINTKQNIDIEEVRANVRKEDRIIDSLNLCLISIVSLLIGVLLTGIMRPTKTVQLKSGSSICYFIK